MSPGLWSRPAAPEGVAAHIQATTGAIFDSRTVAALEQAPGLRIRPLLPRELRCASRGHDRRDFRTRRGLYRGCPQHVGPVTLPPERGAARIRTPTTGVSLALGVAALELPPVHCALELPPVHRTCPAPPRRMARSAFYATTGVIRALGVVPLKLPPEVRICAEPSREKARPAFGTTTGAVPYSMWLLWSEPQGAGLGVASRGRLVSNPTTIIGTSSGRRCCFLELPPGRRVCAAVP